MGNRELQVTEAYTNTYTYDEANRLTAVDSITYTWDANGNLLDDGAKSYEYDLSNRLVSVDDGQAEVTFAYNGLNDRMQQSEGANTTTYTLDIAAGLTQVLEDGTNAYLYGVERIAQEEASSKEYFLGDALGSVRQLADAEGLVTLAKEYQPYGEVISSAGDGVTGYGFTNEWTDSTGLINLRARQYSPSQGRFLTKDLWQGNTYQPMSYNNWIYGYGNPIMIIDPTGMCGIGNNFSCAAPPPPPTGTPEPPGSTGTPGVTSTEPVPPPVIPPIVYHPCLDHEEILCVCNIPSNVSLYPLLPTDIGHMEGFGFTYGVLGGQLSGNEIVYDFATMTRAKFNFTGTIEGLTAGIGVSFYSGPVYGFKPDPVYELRESIYDSQIVSDYSKDSSGMYLGIAPPGSPAGVGSGNFRSLSSAVRGNFYYVSIGFSITPVEIVRFNSYYEIQPYSMKSFSDNNGKVNLGVLIADITAGKDSPIWGPSIYAINYLSSQRLAGVLNASRSVRRFENYWHWKLTNSGEYDD